MLKFIIAGLLILVIQFSPVMPVMAQELNLQQKQWIKKYAQQQLGQQEQWITLMEAMASVESDNGRDRIGKYRSGKLSNCYGLLQVKPSTARDMLQILKIPDIYTEQELIDKLTYDDEFNIRISATYISFLWQLLNEMDLVIVSYNIGQGKVLEILKSGESLPMGYIGKVKERMN